MDVNTHNRSGRAAAFILMAVIALGPQYPAAAKMDAPAAPDERGLTRLPDFNIRAAGRRRAAKRGVDRKKELLALSPAALDKVELRWDEELDLPHHLFSLGAPLTPPSAEGAVAIAERFVRDNSALFALAQGDLEGARVSAYDRDERDGITRLALEQRVSNVRVFDSEMLFALDREGRIVSESGSFIPQIERRAPDPAPALSAEQALHRAAAICGGKLTAPVDATDDVTPARERVVFSSEEVDGRSEASLVYFPVTRDDVRLAYQVLLYGVPDPLDSYLVLVDAGTGEALVRESLTCAADGPTGRVFVKENPISSGEREVASLKGDPNASPQGWVSGGRTGGNNAQVFYNPDLKGGAMVSANADGNFDFPIDLSPGHSPLNSSNASAVNLFYWVNYAHDRFYALGFDEGSRNFQANNFGKGGRGGDALRAETLRGAMLNQSETSQLVRNNAYFSPSLEGTPPMLAMLMWTLNLNGQLVELDSSYDAGVIIHEYTHGVSTRLAGTDNSIGLRSNQGSGMGEGWSDFFAMSFLNGPDKPSGGAFPTGTYVTGRPRGVRAYPYSTSFDTDPLTFGDIRFNTEVHAQGTVWCSILWDMRQGLIERYGFDAGRQAAERLVVGGLKLTPLAPTFIDARNAILVADRAINGGANQDLIWRAFAARGLGNSAALANTAGSGYRINVIEGYDVAPEASAGAIVINDRPGSPIVIGEHAEIVVTDRDLLDSPAVDVHAKNMRTGADAVFRLERSRPGRFAAPVALTPPEGAGQQGVNIIAQPGDEIVFSYANARNESGAAEAVETRGVAGRRVTLYMIDFEQEAAGWTLQNEWHLTSRRATSGATSMYFAKRKGQNDSKSYTKQGSSGSAFSPVVDLQNLFKPRLEFDYFFSGAVQGVQTSSPGDIVSLAARNYPFIGSGSPVAGEPPLALAFDIRPDPDAAFHPAQVELQFIGKNRAYLNFAFAASQADLKRKKLEGFYMDNVRLTAVSTK
ncbi:MAG: M36 family metallopeptidase [Blastocatellia bacterium]